MEEYYWNNEGKLQTRSYEQDGVTKYATDVVGRELTMLGRKSDNPGAQGMGTNSSSNAQNNQKVAEPTPFEAASDDDDLPF